jgi:hypothetical protein
VKAYGGHRDRIRELMCKGIKGDCDEGRMNPAAYNRSWIQWNSQRLRHLGSLKKR